MTFIAFWLGVAVGGISCGLLAQRGWRKVRREITELMKSSMETQDHFYATTAMCYLGTLQKLEAGDVENSKRELANSTANFYHHFTVFDEGSQWIQTQKREIELYAKKSEALRAALDREPNENLL